MSLIANFFSFKNSFYAITTAWLLAGAVALNYATAWANQITNGLDNTTTQKIASLDD